MMVGLDDVDWADLDADGEDGAALPGLIRALFDKKRFSDACWDIHRFLFTYSRYGVTEAAAEALPFLVGAAADDRVLWRDEVLELVGECADAATGMDPLWPARLRWDRRWPEQVDALLALAGDPDPDVRRAALVPLGFSVGPPATDERIAAALRALRSAETDPATAVDVALTLARLGGAEQARGWLEETLEHDDPEVQLAAAAALGELDREHDRAAGLLAAAVQRGDLSPSGLDQWMKGTGLPRSAARLADGAVGTLEREVAQLTDHLGGPQRTSREVGRAAELVATWRSPQQVLLPALAGLLDDRDDEARAYAVHVLAACGPAAAPDTDRIAELLHDRTVVGTHGAGTIGGLALWALSRIDPPRAVPLLAERLQGGRTGFATLREANRLSYALDIPTTAEVLAPLREHAHELLPLLRRRPRAERFWDNQIAAICHAWGAAARPAAPQLAQTLAAHAAADDYDAFVMAGALGGIGPAAADSAQVLRSLRRVRDLPHDGETPGKASLAAAAALCRITGDPDPSLELLCRGLHGPHPQPAVRLLAQSGVPAARRPGMDPHVRRLRELLGHQDQCNRIDAAHALWLLTGDPSESIRAITTALRPMELALPEHHVELAIRYAGELGPAAAQVAPTLRALPTNDLRLGWSGGWHTIDEDHRTRRAATTALNRITDAE